jgi:putative ABC transport system substrate-binding protein
VYRVGNLGVPSRDSSTHLINALEAGLREQGWTVGQNLVTEYRFANSDLDRLPGLAEELVRLNVDVIVTGANPATVAAKNATRTIPIVMFIGGDPVGSGFVASLARPGGNVTGLAAGVGPEIAGKQLEMLKAALPQLSRVAVLVNPARDTAASALREVERATHALGLQPQILEARDAREIDAAFATMKAARPDALFTVGDALFYQHRARLADLALKSRLPTMWTLREHAEAGGLMAYSADLRDLARRAAIYVDKILKGAKPGDLPVEQPAKFDFVINMKTARSLGVSIAPSLLQRADKVIQ